MNSASLPSAIDEAPAIEEAKARLEGRGRHVVHVREPRRRRAPMAPDPDRRGAGARPMPSRRRPSITPARETPERRVEMRAEQQQAGDGAADGVAGRVVDGPAQGGRVVAHAEEVARDASVRGGDHEAGRMGEGLGSADSRSPLARGRRRARRRSRPGARGGRSRRRRRPGHRGPAVPRSRPAAEAAATVGYLQVDVDVAPRRRRRSRRGRC